MHTPGNAPAPSISSKRFPAFLQTGRTDNPPASGESRPPGVSFLRPPFNETLARAHAQALPSSARPVPDQIVFAPWRCSPISYKLSPLQKGDPQRALPRPACALATGLTPSPESGAPAPQKPPQRENPRLLASPRAAACAGGPRAGSFCPFFSRYQQNAAGSRCTAPHRVHTACGPWTLVWSVRPTFL